MIACLDVHYSDDSATAAALLLQDWDSSVSMAEYTPRVPRAADYEPGSFYLRELQPLLAVIQKIHHPIGFCVIDGYCYLSSDMAPGLGVHLWSALGQATPIIGVAKNRYRKSTHAVELLRGESTRPQFITSVGIDYESAARNIASMVGGFRIPTMLKTVDRLTRTPPIP